MIELIFAIVIMGITMMSAPMLIERSTQSTYTALQQESVAAIAAQLNMIMTAEWDHMDTNVTIREPVLKTDSTTFNQCTGAEAHPIGVTAASGRYCKGLGGPIQSYSATPPGNLQAEGHEGGFYDDVDDYNNQSYKVSIYNSEAYETHQGNYIDQNISIVSMVAYGNDTATYGTTTAFSNPFNETNTTATTNIKLISVVLTSTNPSGELSDKNIRLSAFMCNIGAPKPEIVSNEESL